jgi:type I restriction enzyme, S subunit
LRSSNIQKGEIDLSDLVRVNKKVKENLLVRNGDILMCSRNGSKRLVGKTATIKGLPEVMTFGTFMTIIRSPYNQFLALFFNSDYFREQIGGGENTMINQVTKYMLDEVVIRLPPIPEQQRIVAILDEVFAAIAQAKANAERNLKNARELFESYLQSVFENKGEGWEEKTLGEVCKVERGSSPRPIDKYFTDNSDGVNWIKIGDTKVVDKYIYTTKQKITKEGALKSRFVEIDDFILSNSMSFGKPYIMKTQGYIHDGWFVLRLPKNINTEFFWYLLASPYTMNQFVSLAAGAIVKNISGDLVKKTVLPIPPIKEQQIIVQ